jgi:hypothetical protein
VRRKYVGATNRRRQEGGREEERRIKERVTTERRDRMCSLQEVSLHVKEKKTIHETEEGGAERHLLHMRQKRGRRERGSVASGKGGP